MRTDGGKGSSLNQPRRSWRNKSTGRRERLPHLGQPNVLHPTSAHAGCLRDEGTSLQMNLTVLIPKAGGRGAAWTTAFSCKVVAHDTRTSGDLAAVLNGFMALVAIPMSSLG